ncbi:MAG: ChbG/HpnK family deacetylase [Terracidiphilus sp.]|nr:ChbG/HpnK family deacetylase [Terracidiphilus sp.]
MGRLIVNADDFGLTRGVNRAVAELHRMGVVTSTTLMARGGAAEEAIEYALKTPSLSVGCHVVLVDGRPVLSPTREIPNLADPVSGKFRPSLVNLLRAVDRGWPWRGLSPHEGEGAIAGEIEVETAAQIALLQSKGLRLTHVDTHKHTHMFPAVLRPVLRAARAAGISAVRNPFEPAWSRSRTARASLLRRAEVSLLHRLEPAFRRIVAEEGFTTPDGSLGVLATGTLDETTIRSLALNTPPGTWELVTHPGYNDGELDQVRTRLRGSRETERRALTTLENLEGLELIGFAQLAAEAAANGSHSP